MYLVGVLVVVLGVIVSIALHEIGHLVPAKRFGVKCTQYMIGFGPTLRSRRIGETEYGVKAIPLGGYVRMIGMFPPKPDGSRRPDTTGRWALVAEQARHDAQREIGPEDADRLFYQRSVPKRLVIMLGGPVMNLTLAVGLLAVIVCGFGVPTTTRTVSAVSQCILPAAQPDRACTASDPKAPAAQAGFLPGDEIVSFGGTPVTNWAQVQRAIRADQGTPVQVVVRRDGRPVTLTVTPTVTERPVLDANGNAVTGPDGKPQLTSVGFLGLSPTTALQRQSPAVLPGLTWDAVRQTAAVIVTIPAKMVGVAESAVTGSQRDPNGPISLVGIGRAAGEAATAEPAAGAGPTATDRFVSLLSLIASLNIALFVFNLIPLLPLDGGHVAGALWEGLRRRIAQWRHRPDPGPVDIARALPLAYGVVSLLIGMSALLVYADIVNPVSFG
ncbi:MAG TPA: site-2 protease family protein [Kineosporiaceae bacterium]|nr:site-2 protease family protein [Kineosporiaceae bacterium]